MIPGNRQRSDELPAPSGDGQCQAWLVRVVLRYETPLLRYVGQLLRGRPDAAQDVVQETFIRLHRRMAAGEKIERLGCWLFKVAHNLAMDEYRKHHREQSLDGAEAEPAADPAPGAAAVLIRREEHDLAMAELQTLSEEQRQVLLLKVIQGLTLEEISDIMELKVGTVYYRLTTGLQELARRLKAAGIKE